MSASFRFLASALGTAGDNTPPADTIEGILSTLPWDCQRDALAEAGLTRLDTEVRAAIDGAGEDYEARLRATATAYVRFATEDAALMDLMFTAKNAAGSAGPPAAARLFAVTGDLIRQGQQAGALPPGDPIRLQLLFGAMLQGIAALVTAGRIPPSQAGVLVTDAVALFTRAGTEAAPAR